MLEHVAARGRELSTSPSIERIVNLQARENETRERITGESEARKSEARESEAREIEVRER